MRGVITVGDIIYKALTDIFGSFIAATVLLPAAIIFTAYLIYIIVMTIKELRLTNGQYVRFLNGSNRAFSSSAGTRYDFIVQLNRKATMQNCLIQSKLAATEVVEVPDQWTSISPSYSRTARFQNTGYYYFQIESNSSDTVIIMSAELLFS